MTTPPGVRFADHVRSPSPRLPRRLPTGLRWRQLHRVKVNAGTGVDVDKVGDAHLKLLGDPKENVQRRVPPAALNLREVPERHADLIRGVCLRPSLHPPGPLDAGSDALAEGRGAHPDNENPSRFRNVTHYSSL